MKRKRKLTKIGLMGFAVLSLGSCSVENQAQEIIQAYEKHVRPLETAANLAWWNANTSGKTEDFKKKEELQNQLDEALSNRKHYSDLQKLESSTELEKKNPLLHRQIHLLYFTYQPAQVNPDLLKKMNAKSNAIEQAFNVFRAKLGEVEYSANEVNDILKKSNDSKKRQRVWEASKKVGSVLEKDLLELVRLRNQSARELGYTNYHSMMLGISEQKPEQVIHLFDELDKLTRAQFDQVKSEIDSKLALRFKIEKKDLMPWHYQDLFFQEVPAVYGFNPDTLYSNIDISELSKKFYSSIGLPIDSIVSRSSLFEQPGKSPHAFMTDIDREGDVRVLMNIKPSHYWMSTALHEFGHSIYSSVYMPKDEKLPYILRNSAHTITTEGLAMMLQRLPRKSEWFKQLDIKVPNSEAMDLAGKTMQKAELLIFSRWAQVMLRFEKGMYENPEQDLSKLWWDLVEKYQGLKRPAGRTQPDYATKIHVVSSPCYYHNYLMGELFASQVHRTIAETVLQQKPYDAVYVNQPAVGEFLKEKIIAPGATLDWNALTKFATGSDLNPTAFAKDLE